MDIEKAVERLVSLDTSSDDRLNVQQVGTALKTIKWLLVAILAVNVVTLLAISQIFKIK